MTDIPVIFSAPMIRALLEDRKTMTRRLAWRRTATPTPWQRVKPGDRLYVRENFSFQEIDGDRIEEFGGVHYWADGNPTFGNWTRPKPSIHMPRVVSRLTLIVTATKIERLQDISEADAIAEGAEINPIDHRHRTGFAGLWRSLHGDESWTANPEVVALTFRVVKANLDAPEAMAA